MPNGETFMSMVSKRYLGSIVLAMAVALPSVGAGGTRW